MKSLTVFDPKKVFTEVTKVNHAVLQYSWHLQTHRTVAMPLAMGQSKHIKFFFTKTLYTRTFKSPGPMALG